jgi:hypothetical protein
MKSGVLVARTVERADLTLPQRDAMWRLFSTYYADVTRAGFERDLAEKQHVIIVSDSGDGSCQGFSTLQVYERVIEGKKVVAIFSGDTLIDKAYWGQMALQRAFFLYIVQVKVTHPMHEVYWFLISKGYKTYLLLAKSLPTYWPRFDAPTPSFERKLIDSLAREKHPDAWLPERGVLSFDEPQGRLKAGIAPIDAQALALPEVRFFLERNPGHTRGDELCCLGKVDARLALVYSRKLLRKLLAARTTTLRPAPLEAESTSS